MTRLGSVKRTVFRILDPDTRDTGIERGANLVLAALIALNVAAVVLETVRALRESYAGVFAALELVSVGVFTAEYLLRVWSCTVDPRYAHPIRGRLRFALSPMALIDLAAILPAYLPHVVLDLRYARALRLMRLLRALKLARYSRSIQTFSRVFTERRGDLALVLVLLLVLLILASSSMYFAENAAQPEAFSSIPASMWWAMVTVTTVGYGDMYPVTPVGKLLGTVVALLGIGLFALPAGILASGLSDELQRGRSGEDQRCPHCGGEL